MDVSAINSGTCAWSTVLRQRLCGRQCQARPPHVFVRRVVRRSFVFHSPFFHPASGTRTTDLHRAPEVDRLALRQSFTCCRKSFDRRSSCVVRRMPADSGKFCSTSCVVHRMYVSHLTLYMFDFHSIYYMRRTHVVQFANIFVRTQGLLGMIRTEISIRMP